MLVGTWYGDQPTKNGGRRQWIMRRAEDGTFQVTFRVSVPKKGVEEQTEFGDWGVSANLLITLTRGYIRPDGGKDEVGGADSYFWDVYEVQEVSDSIVRYRSVETKNAYRANRVRDDFAFPKEPNQTPEPTPAAVTSPAAKELRQP
jgi:hypothetical protein